MSAQKAHKPASAPVAPKRFASLHDVAAVLAELAAAGDPSRLAHAAKVGIPVDSSFGVPTAEVRRMGRRLGRDHALALALWATRQHEARLLAILVAEPSRLSDKELDAWVADIGSWDLCDHLCNNLVCRKPGAEAHVFRWANDPRLYVRRAGLATIAYLVVHRPELDPDLAEAFLGVVASTSTDSRPHVKKAASWALREIGKRDETSHDRAVACAANLLESSSAASRWVAKDALHELENLITVPERRRLLNSKSKMGRRQHV